MISLILLLEASSAAPPLSEVMTTSGKPCVFPFTYKNVVYYECTTVDYAKPWCAIKTDELNHDGDYCIAAAPTTAAPATAAPATAAPATAAPTMVAPTICDEVCVSGEPVAYPDSNCYWCNCASAGRGYRMKVSEGTHWSGTTLEHGACDSKSSEAVAPTTVAPTMVAPTSAGLLV